MAERWRTRLTELLGHELQGEQPLILYASPGRFRQTNVVDTEIGEGVGGFAEFFRRRLVMEAIKNYKDIFNGPAVSFGPNIRQGANSSFLAEVKGGKWTRVTEPLGF